MTATCSNERDRTALVEASGVFVATMLYIWWLRLWHPWVIVTLLGFVVGTHFARHESVRRVGFGITEFRRAFPAVFPWIAGLALVIIAAGTLLGTARGLTPLQIAASILVYIAWGLFQQYILNGYFVNRLREYAPDKTKGWVALMAGLLFAVVHTPNWFLMLVTLIGGYVCARVYLRYRSLYLLAIAHGVIGFLLFLYVPDSINGHFLVGPRYLIDCCGIYPELLL